MVELNEIFFGEFFIILDFSNVIKVLFNFIKWKFFLCDLILERFCLYYFK